MKTHLYKVNLFLLIILVMSFSSCDEATPCKCAQLNYWLKNEEKCHKAAHKMGLEQWNKEMVNCYNTKSLDENTELSKDDQLNNEIYKDPRISIAHINLCKYRTVTENWNNWSETDIVVSFNMFDNLIIVSAAKTFNYNIFYKKLMLDNKYYFRAYQNNTKISCDIIIKLLPEKGEIIIDIIYSNKEIVYKGFYQ